MARHAAVLAVAVALVGVAAGCSKTSAPPAVGPTSTAVTMPLDIPLTSALPSGLKWNVVMHGDYQGASWDVSRAVADDGRICLHLRTDAEPAAAPFDATAFCKPAAPPNTFAAAVTGALRGSVVLHLAFAPSDAVFSGPALEAAPTFAEGLVALVLDGTKRRLDVTIGSMHLSCVLSDYAYPGDCPPT